jgi:hypothetical protein
MVNELLAPEKLIPPAIANMKSKPCATHTIGGLRYPNQTHRDLKGAARHAGTFNGAT